MTYHPVLHAMVLISVATSFVVCNLVQKTQFLSAPELNDKKCYGYVPLWTETAGDRIECASKGNDAAHTCIAVEFNTCTSTCSCYNVPYSISSSCQQEDGVVIYERQDDACPSGFRKYGSSMCYRLTGVCGTWSEGLLRCQRYGGYLVEFSDLTFLAFFQALLQNTDIGVCPGASFIGIWAGGRRVSDAQVRWFWLHGQSVNIWPENHVEVLPCPKCLAVTSPDYFGEESSCDAVFNIVCSTEIVT